MADQIGQPDVPVFFDQAIYAKAVKVICHKSEGLSHKTNGRISRCIHIAGSDREEI